MNITAEESEPSCIQSRLKFTFHSSAKFEVFSFSWNLDATLSRHKIQKLNDPVLNSTKCRLIIANDVTASPPMRSKLAQTCQAKWAYPPLQLFS